MRLGTSSGSNALSHSVRRLDAKTGKVSTIAGTARRILRRWRPSQQGAVERAARIGLDKAEDLYICDVKNHRIRKVDMKRGTIFDFCRHGRAKADSEWRTVRQHTAQRTAGLDFDNQGNLWLALREGNAILKLDVAAGTVHQAAGTGKKGFTGDAGPAKDATLSGPKGLSVAPNGNVTWPILKTTRFA